MSHSEYGSIVFSRALAQGPSNIRLSALHHLNHYLNNKPHLHAHNSLFAPLESYLNGREKIYSGKEILAGHLTPEDKMQVGALGFSVRSYRSTLGRDAGYVTINISKALAKKTLQEKTEAIYKLEDYFESHPNIWTGFDYPVSIAEAVDRVISGTNKKYLSKNTQIRIIGGLLTKDQAREISGLGLMCCAAPTVWPLSKRCRGY